MRNYLISVLKDKGMAVLDIESMNDSELIMYTLAKIIQKD